MRTQKFKKSGLIKIFFALAIFLQLTGIEMYANQKEMKDENLITLPVKNEPTISFKIWFKVGSQNDPAGKEGLAYLTSRMISDGATKNNSYETILEKLYPLAAGYNAIASTEMTVYSGRIHKDNVQEYYPLFIDGILRPAFNEDDFKRIKDEALSYLQTTLKYSSDEELGKAVLYNFIFEDTPYGHILPGTIPGITSITLDDIRAFYKNFYTAQNYTIGIGGSYTPELLSMLQKDLGTLPGTKVESVAKPDYKKIEGLEAVIVNKQAAATAISIGFPIDILRGSKEWYALAITNSWMGEHRNSSSHLYQVIREKRGLNYGDYSYIENYPRGGQLQLPPTNVARRQQIFEIWIRPVPNETRHFALRAAIRELQKLVDNGMNKNDFELTKKFLSKYVLHYAEDTDTRLGYAIDDMFYNINGSHLQKFREMMKEITLEDVNNAIKKNLQYKNMKIAIITTDAEKLKNDLVSNAESPITYSTPKPDEVMQEDKEIIKYPLDFKEAKIKVMAVEDLLK